MRVFDFVFFGVLSFAVVVEADTAASYELRPFSVDAESIGGMGRSAVVGLVSAEDESYEFAELFESPGLFAASADAGNFGSVFSSRGVANTQFFGASSISTYVDGVPSLSVYAAPTELVGIEDSIFLKGSQSGYQGQNSPAGTVHLTTKAVGTEAESMYSMTVGDHDLFGDRFVATRPIELWDGGVAVTGYRKTQDGFVENAEGGATNKGDQDRSGARVKFTGGIFPNLDGQLIFAWDAVKDGEQPYTPLGEKAFETSEDFLGATESETALVAAMLKGEFGETEWSASTSRTRWELAPYRTQFSLFGATFSSDLNQKQEQRTHEFRISRSDEEDVSWEVGVYSQERDTEGGVSRQAGGWPFEASAFSLDEEVYAVWGNFSKRVNESVLFGASFRGDRTEIGYMRENLLEEEGALYTDEYSDESLQGSVFVSYDLGERQSWVLRASRSEKPGGFSSYTDSPKYIKHERELIEGLELNWNWVSEENSVGADVSAFYNVMDGYQVERSFSETDYATINAEEAVAKGLEISVWARPIESLLLDFSHGYTRGRFTKYIDPEDGMDLSGKRLPFMPETVSTLEIRWEFGNYWMIRGVTRYVGSVFYDDRNEAVGLLQMLGLSAEAESYVTADLSLAFKKGGLLVEVGVDNLFNEEYVSFMNTGIIQQMNGDPRLGYLKLSLGY